MSFKDFNHARRQFLLKTGVGLGWLSLAELLGTPAAHKQLVILEGGHFPHDIRGLVRHTLDWFDKYLGPVR